MEAKKIKVRFPPSPTGEWHFGNVRTFVFNYLFARQKEGEIVLRFEDTDTARNKEGADKKQMEVLKVLGLDFDEGPYYQSQRKDIYEKELRRLIKEDKAYEAEENQSGTGKVIRIRNTAKDIVWKDLVKGEIKISSDSFKDDKGNIDFIIARSITDPLYHFTVVVDDYLMGITHVLRGEDHVTSTPRQMIILEALGAPIPFYGHFPTILGENKKKLGKRNGAVPVREYLDKGYLPDALLNAISLLGWNPGGEQEIFTKEELIQKFSLERVQQFPAVFTGDKLDYINKEHLKLLPEEEKKDGVLSAIPEKYKENKITEKLIPIIFERISKWGDVKTLFEAGDFDFFYSAPAVQSISELLCPEKLRKGKEVSNEELRGLLKQSENLLSEIPEEEFTSENIKNALWDFATEKGRGIVLWAIRYALSGLEKSPDPFQISSTIGKTETLNRIRHAAEK